VITGSETVRLQLTRQVAHWSAATVALDNPEDFAGPGAWASLERYLDLALRRRVKEAVTQLRREADLLAANLAAARTDQDLEDVRRRIVAFRARFIQVETLVDFFGDAVNTRTNTRMAGILRALDLLAHSAIERVLGQLGRETPAVLTYVDKGIGASILRAGLRLWDRGSPSPVAAIKITRHNLFRPTALLHEAGHQIAGEVGWNAELARTLGQLVDVPPEVRAAWSGWASEAAADAIAFAFAGYASVATLHDVLAGEQGYVFRDTRGDPHPVPWIRVLFNVEMCVRTFGRGPWDDLRTAWLRAHPADTAPQGLRSLLTASVAALPAIVSACLATQMTAFRGRSLVQIVDPALVSPASLAALTRANGPALTTSHVLLRREGLRLMALSGFLAATRPDRAREISSQYERWVLRLGSLVPEAA
jgi:hypothetical protein